MAPTISTTQSSGKERPVIIAGGGIGGLGAALALARAGRPAEVLEQSDVFGEVGAGIQLGPNVFHRFRRLGIEDAVRATAVLPSALVMKDALDGSEITRMPLGQPVIDRFGAPYGVIHRADLHTALLEACQAHPLIGLETQKKVTGFEDTADGVAVDLADGSRRQGAALIGADGLWSTVRQQIVGDGEPIVSGHIAYRAVLPMEEVPPECYSDAVTLWAGPRSHLVHYPLRSGTLYNLVAVFHSNRYEEGWNSYGDPEELWSHFRGQRPEVLRLLEKIESWRMWVLCDREPVKTWSKGRATLVGDAAHPMLQYLAQGACMALEDAVCLTDCVDTAGGDFASGFQAYQQQRYLRTARVQTMARVYGEFYHAAGVKAELRKLLLSSRTPEQAYDGMAWLYGG